MPNNSDGREEMASVKEGAKMGIALRGEVGREFRRRADQYLALQVEKMLKKDLSQEEAFALNKKCLGVTEFLALIGDDIAIASSATRRRVIDESLGLISS